MKTPSCTNCGNKLYVVNIRRENIGYICPDCDSYIIKQPTKYFNKLQKKIQKLKTDKPTFKQKSYTICEKCGKSEYVKCKKNTKRPYKGRGFGPNTWVCWCENPKHKEDPWTQNRPKILVIPYYKKS